MMVEYIIEGLDIVDRYRRAQREVTRLDTALSRAKEAHRAALVALDEHEDPANATELKDVAVMWWRRVRELEGKREAALIRLGEARRAYKRRFPL